MKDIIFIAIIIIVPLLIGEYFLRRKLNVLKHEKMSQRPKRFETIGVTIMFISFLIVSITLISGNDEVDLLLIVLPFYFIISVFRAFMEWRYNRQAKKWALEIYSIFAIGVAVAVLLLVGDKFIG